MKYSVEFVWVDENDKQVGVRLNNGSAWQDVSIDGLRAFRGQLINADVTTYGVRGKAGITLRRSELTRHTGVKRRVYTLMHADKVVCHADMSTNMVEVVTQTLLPFSLRGIGFLSAADFDRWLTERVSNLNRSYMNKVYIVRKVGRDREKVLRDSCGTVFIDNFWLKFSDMDMTWDKLIKTRDMNIILANVALTGQISEQDFKKAAEDTTSLFVVKGVFTKSVIKGYILKKGENSRYEAVAYILGKVLGVDIAEATKREGDVVACRIFTTLKSSMAHAKDFLHLTDYEDDRDWHRATYEYFEKQGRQDIVHQLGRLYLFNYLVLNSDFHYENYGFMYDSSTFEITGVAPGFDFNSAFDPVEETSLFYEWIVERLPMFILNNPDIKERLRSSAFYETLSGISDLSPEQKAAVKSRANYLCNLN